MTDLLLRLKSDASLVEEALLAYFEAHNAKKTTLYEAMQYSTMCGGKRIRPFLVLEFCRLFGGDVHAALPYACAIEMIHTFSLIHDDLPAMDNDDFRRGKPTCHKVYGEAPALLAGDALIFAAYQAALENSYTDDANRVRALHCLSIAAGADGMCEGQMIDIACEGKSIEFEKLLSLHAHKTGALIRAAARLGAIAAGAGDKEIACADLYGEKVGLAFQIVDDVLDRIGDAERLGKPIGSDEKNQKNTFLSYMSIEDAMQYAKRLTSDAESCVSCYSGADTLCQLAKYLLERTN